MHQIFHVFRFKILISTNGSLKYNMFCPVKEITESVKPHLDPAIKVL